MRYGYGHMDSDPKPNGDWTPSAWESERHPQAADTDPDEVANPRLRSADAHRRTVYGPHGVSDVLWVTVLDANGTLVARGNALLQRDDAPDGLGPTYTIRYTDLALAYVGDGGRRELLPVRPQPITPGVEYPVPDTTSPTATVSANYGPLSHSITHGHAHSHPTSPLAQPTSYDHAHRHTHYGDYAHRADAFGHTNDSHGDHAH